MQNIKNSACYSFSLYVKIDIGGLIMEKYVYLFNEGNKDMRNLLGGKGANLAEMTNIGLPVPRGFTVTTEACNKYYDDGKVLDDAIVEEIKSNLEKLESITGKKFGDLENPLLVSAVPVQHKG